MEWLPGKDQNFGKFANKKDKVRKKLVIKNSQTFRPKDDSILLSESTFNESD